MNERDVMRKIESIRQMRKLYDAIDEIIALAKTKPKVARAKLAKNKNIDIFLFVRIVEENDRLTSDQLRTLFFGGFKCKEKISAKT